MGSFGLLALALGFIAGALYLHKRHAYWVGFGLATVAGILLAVTTQGRWAAALIGQIPHAPFVIVGVGAVIIGLDIRDKRPDRPAVMLAIFVPMFLALAVADVPHVVAAIGNALNHVGTDTANSAR